jgi:hypothetical protein
MRKNEQISNALGLDWKHLRIPGAEVEECYQDRLKPFSGNAPRETGSRRSSAQVLRL